MYGVLVRGCVRSSSLFSILILFALGSGSVANAKAMEYIWDNVRGFVSADDCKVDTADKTDLLVIGQTGVLNNSGKRIPSIEGTIVKMRPDIPDFRVEFETYKAIRVIVAPHESDLTCDLVSKRGDLGYIIEQDIQPLDKYEITVRSLKGLRVSAQNPMMGSAGSIWRVAKENNRNVIYRCGDRKYMVFNVFASDDARVPTARVGIWKDQTEIFTDIDVDRVPEHSTQQGPAVAMKSESKSAPPPVGTSEVYGVIIKEPSWKTADGRKAARELQGFQSKSEPSEQNYAGQICNINDRDPLKCMICVMNGEATPTSRAGMVAIGRLMMERASSGLYPKDLCKVAYQSQQFVGLWNGRQISRDAATVARMTGAARESMVLGGNGYLQFRACTHWPYGENLGGNCFFDKRNQKKAQTGDLNKLLDGRLVENLVGVDDEPKPKNMVQVVTEEQMAQAAQVPRSIRAML